MREFETPAIEVKTIDVADEVTASATGPTITPAEPGGNGTVIN